MRPKECAKYVYRLMPNKSYYRYFNGEYIHMDFEFPDISYAFDYMNVKKISFLWHSCDAIAWRDKHGNIIVRVHHADTQTKIDF